MKTSSQSWMMLVAAERRRGTERSRKSGRRGVLVELEVEVVLLAFLVGAAAAGAD